MNRNAHTALILLIGLSITQTSRLVAQPPAGQATAETAAVLYSRDIQPILQKNCIACHRSGQSEGGLSLEDSKAIAAGGDSGDLIDLKQPDASLLVARVMDDDDPMPPEENTVGAKRLTPDEIAKIKTWISQGAAVDAETMSNAQTNWQPIPDSIRTTYSLAVSPDAQVVAVARANRIEILDASSGQSIQQLSDPRLDQAGAADVDLVQSLAFSPLGDTLATGGYRTVRIWKRTNKTAPQFEFLAGCGKSHHPVTRRIARCPGQCHR